MEFKDYVKPELLILIPVLYLIGTAIKNSKIDDKHIPLILGAVGVFLSGVYLIATEPINNAQTAFTAIFTAITQGVLCAGASVYINQLIKQEKKGD